AGSAEAIDDWPSAERCDRFLAQAAQLGLMQPAVKSLSLREFIGAPLLLPVYIRAASSAISESRRRAAESVQRWMARREMPTIYATLVPDPARHLALAGVRGLRMTPTLAYQA